MIMKESKLEHIVVAKERDYKGMLGEIQFWEESDENLETRVTLNNWDAKENTQGKHIGQLKLNSNFITPKMAKKLAKLLKQAFQQSNPKVKTIYIAN